MIVSSWCTNKRKAGSIRTRIKVMLPLSFLLLTCCMSGTAAIARQDVESNAKPAKVATAVPPQVQPQRTAQLVGSSQTSHQTEQDKSDVVNEGRLLLAEKSSKMDTKKSKGAKNAPPAKRLDASAEEEEDEDEDDDADAEEDATTSKSSPKGGAATGARLKSIQSDFYPALRAELMETTVRGSVLTVVVSLTFRGNKDGNELTVKELGYCGSNYTWITVYETGTKFYCNDISGFSGGEIKSGETKNLRINFGMPKEAKNAEAVGITLYHLGTFDDVKLGSSGGSLSSKPTGSSKTEDIEEEDEEDEADVDEEDSKDLVKKKGAKKGAK